MNNPNKIVWITDPHYNFLTEEKVKILVDKVVKHQPTHVFITGDISEAPTLELHLRYFEMLLVAQLPDIKILFICGNHDFYKGSIAQVRGLLREKFSGASKSLWMPATGIVSLNQDTAVIGHDGWYDGGYEEHGNWFHSKLMMSDYYIINEFKWCVNRTTAVFDLINQLSKESADYVYDHLIKAFETNNKVFLLTHVAPFPENAKGPNGQMSDKNWMPHFSSKKMGDAIITAMQVVNTKENGHKNQELIVLCGHSHTRAIFQPLTNVKVITGAAKYGHPKVADVFSY